MGRLIGLLLALFMAMPLAAAAQTSGTADVTATETERWPHVLPFLADEAVKRGYELPLPFGITGVFYYVERDVEITDIRVGINGAPLRSVSNFLSAESTSHVTVAVARFDAWIFPFLNVYGIAGYVSNNTTTRGTVTVPRPGPIPGDRTFNVSAKTQLEGFVAGGGTTVAGGYRELFFLGDVNYGQTDIGFDDRFRALIGSVRVGWNGKILDTPTRF
jgi:hypothetical protein